jgi:hypothetical protein
MLMFVIEELNKDKSILFKGYNKTQMTIVELLKKEKEKHNALSFIFQYY